MGIHSTDPNIYINIHFDNIKRSIQRMLVWQNGDVNKQVDLLDRTIIFCQNKKKDILSGKQVEKEKEKTRHG